MRGLVEVLRPVRAVKRRIRLQRAMNTGATLGVASLGAAVLVLALAKVQAIEWDDARVLFIVLGLAPLLGSLIRGLRPVPDLWAAKLLDRAHGFEDTLSSAVEFERRSAAERTSFMGATLQVARARATQAKPSLAYPLYVPRDVAACLGLALALGFFAWVHVATPLQNDGVTMNARNARLLHPDDLDAFQNEIDDVLRDPAMSDDVREAAAGFNQIIEDLAEQRLDRTEALRRIAELERRMLQGRRADADTLRESLRELSRSLERSRLTSEAAEALRDGNAARAEQAMRDLAERLRREQISRAELDRLREALRRASTNRNTQQAELERRRAELQRLLQREREKKQLSQNERRLLQRRQRELDRLERARQQVEEQRRQLDRLQRELGRAAEDLNRNRSDEAAQSLDRSAEDLNRMAREQLSNEQMQQLQEQLRELRELMRRNQNQQAGQGGNSRMERFVLQARGGQGGTRLLMPGRGQGGNQQGGQQQGGKNGQNGQNRLLVPGQGGNAQLEIPGMGQGTQRGSTSGSSQPGPGAGTGHDPQSLENPTQLSGTRRNIRVEGEQGEGPNRSEVILSAAERGFASRSYQKVYTDYRGHAEAVLEQDEIPSGYRFYVRRYFQLIRPREAP